MTVLAFPIEARRQPETFDRLSERPASYNAMMVYRHGLGRPWLDLLSHDDQTRIARGPASMIEGK